MAELDLATLANYAQVLGLLAIAGGLAFGLVQMRENERRRRENAAIELVRAFQSGEWTRAALRVVELPEGLSAEEIARRDPEAPHAILYVLITFENLGLLVHRGVVPFDLVAELMGGFAVGSWKRARPWVLKLREDTGSQRYGEWYQWLVERIEERGKGSATSPAFERYRAWKP